MFQSIDTYIFDLDGTLLDTLPDLVILTNKALREEGFPERTSEEILSYVGNGVRALMLKAVPEGATEEEVTTALENWKAMYPEYGSALTKEYEGITPMLRTLRERGKKLGVLSNKFDAGVTQLIDGYFPGLFEAAHGECDYIPRKPDPAGLLYTIKELGSTPEKTVYVGDSPTDVLTAHNAGVKSIAVTWGYHHAENFNGSNPDALVDAPAEILGLDEQQGS